MIVLDENIDADQGVLLRQARLHTRQIGVDLGRWGLLDSDILPLLQRLSRPTLFTRDQGLYARCFCHPRYGLVVLDVGAAEVATFVRRVLAHPRFSQVRNRMGRVLIASHEGLRSWTLHATTEERHDGTP